MVTELGIYQLDIDAERTRAFYRTAPGIGCGCDGCKNYEQAISAFPPSVRDFFHQFGIDPAKPAEVYPNYAPSEDRVLYGGFYHVCGTILKGTEPWIQTGERQFQLDDQYRVTLEDGYCVFLTKDVQLLEDGFPTPAFQIEIEFLMPWVLCKPNTYL